MTIEEVVSIYNSLFIWAILGVFCFMALIVIWGIKKNRWNCCCNTWYETHLLIFLLPYGREMALLQH